MRELARDARPVDLDTGAALRFFDAFQKISSELYNIIGENQIWFDGNHRAVVF